MDPLAAQLRMKAVKLESTDDVPDELIALAAKSQFVLLGEASHGTHEFYKYRGEITKRLIVDHGFNAVAVEADFPDAYRVNRYIRGSGADSTANEALSDFKRFPLWMWRNADALDFVGWMRTHNDERPTTGRVGFYGMDLYSLHSSMAAVLDYLNSVDPAAARRARYRYSCFDHFGEDPQHYGYAASYDLESSCENEVIAQLSELRQQSVDYMNRDGFVARDEYFFAEQNARLVKNAEQYYREMFRGRVSSWNLRDRHMTETLLSLAEHLRTQGQHPKIIVWAHNSHLGDARATQMGAHGELNVGQLIREKYDSSATLIGFTTYTGTVTAASHWGESSRLKRVRPSLNGSYEFLFHETGIPCFFLNCRDSNLEKLLSGPRLERAIGVIYRPGTERVSHYFDARLSRQFDAVVHFDSTRGVEPLDKSSGWLDEDIPETYPEGL